MLENSFWHTLIVRFCNAPLLLFFLGLIAGIFSSIFVYSLGADILFNRIEKAFQTQDNPRNVMASSSEDTSYQRSITPETQKVFEQANILSKKNQCSKALPMYLELKKQWPRALGLLNNIAICYTQQGKLEQARTLLEQAINYDEGLKIPHHNLTRLYSRLSRLAYQKVQIGIDIRNSPSARELRQNLSPSDRDSSLELATLGSFFGISMQNTSSSVTALPPRKESTASSDSIPSLKVPQKKATPTRSTTSKLNPVVVASHTVNLPKLLLVSQQATTPNSAPVKQSKKIDSQDPSTKKQPLETVKKPSTEVVKKPPLEIVKQSPAKVLKQSLLEIVKAGAIQKTTPDNNAKVGLKTQTSDTATPTPSRKPENKKKTPSSSPKKKAANKKVQLRAVQNELIHWVKAWSNKNLEGYFSHYSNRFKPNQSNIDEWRKKRTKKIGDKKQIRIDISHLKIKIDRLGKKANAVFLQTYHTQTISLRTRKRLDFIFENNRWYIVSEKSI